MLDMTGDAWARWVFGDEDGPRLRQLIPAMVHRVHVRMVHAQSETSGSHEGVYGQIWREVFDEFIEVIGAEFPHANIFRPKAAVKGARPANYCLASLAGVPIYPWRYAHNLRVSPSEAKFVSGGRPSATRVDLLSGRVLGNDPTLFEYAAAVLKRPPQEDEARADLEQMLREESVPRAVVVRFASSPYGLARIIWGDATLKSDGTLHGDFSEDLQLPSGTVPEQRNRRKRAVNDGGARQDDARRGFADGPLDRPKLRPRRTE